MVTLTWAEPYSYPITDDYVIDIEADTKELFCLEACHINTSDTDFPVATFRGASPDTKRAHYMFDYSANIGGTTEPERYANYGNPNYYFVSKAVGLVMGVNSGYTATGVGEMLSYNESAIDINLSLPMGDITADTGRALCTTCHNPHGSNVDGTWGHGGTETDDNMLREKKTDGTYFLLPYEQCDVCHK